MDSVIKHSILIVDDEIKVGKVLIRLIEQMGISAVYAPDGKTGLEIVTTVPKAFSIIISDQQMPGMLGHEFLEKVRKISPDTIRFLITGYTDEASIIDVINWGGIHRYIKKPWDNQHLTTAIKDGLAAYERIIENEQLLSLAKEQNLKLYKLSTDLQENARLQKDKLKSVDLKNKKLRSRIARIKSKAQPHESKIKTVITQLLSDNDLLTIDGLDMIQHAALKELYEQFYQIAIRNSFEIPEARD